LIKPKKYKNLTITLLGLAFRGGVSDTRLSPTYEVIKELQRLKVKEIRVHDPLVKKDDLLSRYRNTFLINDLDLALQGADLIMVIADHNEYKKLNNTNIGKSALYDGRGITMEGNLHGVRHAMIGNLN
jgi:UDP-N-acetyl-D-mannosaminuronate dehydrogenase